MNVCIHRDGEVRRLVATLGSLLFVLVSIVPFAAGQARTTTLKGEIADDQLNCIQNPINAPAGLKDKTSCVLYYAHFVKPGSKYVLYDPATKTKYQLDNQGLAQPYIEAKSVQIIGSLDASTNKIHIKEIRVP